MSLFSCCFLFASLSAFYFHSFRNSSIGSISVALTQYPLASSIFSFVRVSLVLLSRLFLLFVPLEVVICLSCVGLLHVLVHALFRDSLFLLAVHQSFPVSPRARFANSRLYLCPYYLDFGSDFPSPSPLLILLICLPIPVCCPSTNTPTRLLIFVSPLLVCSVVGGVGVVGLYFSLSSLLFSHPFLLLFFLFAFVAGCFVPVVVFLGRRYLPTQFPFSLFSRPFRVCVANTTTTLTTLTAVSRLLHLILCPLLLIILTNLSSIYLPTSFQPTFLLIYLPFLSLLHRQPSYQATTRVIVVP